MDDIIYQCPECNFNAEDLTELDVHLLEFHSNSVVKNQDDYFYNENEDEFIHDEDEDIIIENEIPATATQVLFQLG